jgi:uncharacterized DUF497 family protein
VTTRVEINGLWFEWDEEKEALNIRDHGIDFRTAALAFFDPHCLIESEKTTADEQRWVLLGMAADVLLLFVVYTEGEHNEQETTRIISARKASKGLWRRYHRSRQKA